jgi:hypothetical protein
MGVDINLMMMALIITEYKMKVIQQKDNHLMMTLPLAWVRAIGLTKSDFLKVEVLSDGSLKITPLKNEKLALSGPSNEEQG